MKRVLVPIDFSESSINALRYGIEIANKFGAALRIIHVKTSKSFSKDFMEGDVNLLIESNVSLLMEKVQEKYQYLYTVPNGEFDYKIREGAVVREITNQAKYDDSSLIVVGTHGASGIEEKWIGSNAFKLVTDAPCPVLTVRKEVKYREIKSILLPVDYRAQSRQKVPVVAGFAKLFNAKVYVVGIQQSKFLAPFSKISNYVRQVHSYIEKEAYLNVESIMMPVGSTPLQIVELAEKMGVDVVSTQIEHTGNPFEGMFSNFNNELLNKSVCPVLSVPTTAMTFWKSNVSLNS